MSDCTAVCRARVEVFKTLKAKTKDIMQSNQELWRLKQDLAKCIWADLEGELWKAVDGPRYETMSTEFLQAFPVEANI